MDENKKIQQPQYNSLDHFIEHSNNYWNWWADTERGESRREEPYFQRFMKKYPHFSKWLIKRVSKEFWDYRSEIDFEERLPWDQLYTSYDIISEMVFEKDFAGKNWPDSYKQRFLRG